MMNTAIPRVSGKFIRTCASVSVLALIAACGGGGGGGGDSGSTTDTTTNTTDNSTTTTTPQSSPLDESNYEAVAEFAYASSGVAGAAGQTSGVVAKPPGSAAKSARPITEVATCDSGSGTTTRDVVVEGQISDGDLYEDSYNQCRSSYPNGYGYIENDGKISMVYSGVSGSPFTSPGGTATVDVVYEGYSLTFSFSGDTTKIGFDGDLRIMVERTSTQSTLRQTASHFALSVTDVDGTVAYDMSNMDYTVATDLATDATQSIGSYDMDMAVPEFSGSFLVTINTPLVTLSGADYASSGKITLNDNNSPAILTISIISEGMADVALDKDGDGTPEATSVVDLAQGG